MTTFDWRDVHAFWFPAEMADGDLDYFVRRGKWWMQGGATPELPPFLPYVEAAAAGELDHWAETAEGRLSLIIVLDQFPRGLFAGTPRAYAYDQVTLGLCEEGLADGQAAALAHPFEQFFFTLPMVHAEGPDHLERLHRLREMSRQALPELVRNWPQLRPIFEFSISQIEGNIEVISRYGRFPHRNDVLGRSSTEAERAYIEAGDFVHLRQPGAQRGGGEGQ